MVGRSDAPGAQVIPAPVFAHSVQMLGAWFLVTEAGAIACPDRATANRINDLLAEHGMVGVPDSLEGVEWAQ
jgi:hypothetical protein